jgi:CRP/FNR family cyclic AMP-dependent transcriptional regulator
MQKSEPKIDPHKIVAEVGPGLSTSNFKKDQAIVVQGEAADAIYFIQKGRVKATVTSKRGKEAVVGILGEGEFFGEGCLAGQSLRTSTMSALSDCRVTSITRAAMIAALQDQQEFARHFMDHLLNRNSRVQEDVIDQLFNSSERRLARVLLLLANYGKGGGAPIVPVKVTQETLADMIGTTRSRVSFFMNKFRKLGFIHYNGKIVVYHSLLNAVLDNKPESRADEPS